jgi:hypothetical protein
MNYARRVALSPTAYRFTGKDYHPMAAAGLGGSSRVLDLVIDVAVILP